MRRMWMVVFTFVPALAAAQDFTGFEIPEHRWHSIQGSLSGSGSTSTQSVQGVELEQMGLRGFASATASWEFDSDDLRHTLALHGSANGTRSESSSIEEPPFAPDGRRYLNDSSGENLRQQWNANAGLRFYPGPGPIGFSVSGSAVGAYGQDWRVSSTDRTEQDSLQSFRELQSDDLNVWTYQYNVRVSSAVGVGRVRDASAVYQAWLLEERLQRDGVLARPLSSAARRRIASLFFVGLDYRFAHDRVDKFFWRDLEHILAEDGVLAAGALDAYSLLHVLEPAGARLQRRTGFFVGPTFTADYRYASVRSTSHQYFSATVNDTIVNQYSFTSGNRREDNDRIGIVGVAAEYYHPFGPHWQLDLYTQGSYETGWVSWATNAQLTWIVAERWLASGFAQHTRAAPMPGETEDRSSGWTVDWGGNLEYFLQDRISLSLRANANQGSVHLAAGAGGGHHLMRNGSVNLGLNYRFSGALDAPGIVDPVRPIANPGPGY